MRPLALLLAFAALAATAQAKDAAAPPPIQIPPPPPLPRSTPPPPVVMPRIPPPRPNIMDSLRTERDLRETERHIDLLEQRLGRGELTAREAGELNQLRENARRLRGQ